MRPYGMTRLEVMDDDAGGCSDYGRATAVYALPNNKNGDLRAYRSLRGGAKAKAKARRPAKRRSRAEGKAAARNWE